MWSLGSNNNTSMSTERAIAKKPINTAIKTPSVKTEKAQPVKPAAQKPALPKTQQNTPPAPNTPKPTPSFTKPRKRSSAVKSAPVVAKPKAKFVLPPA